MISIIQGPVDSRKVLWLVDSNGCGGKSSFVKWQCEVRARTIAFGYAKATDILHLALKKGPQRVYFFDLTRAKTADLGIQDLYMAIEQIKTGHIINGKYEGGSLRFKYPHVVVFSNQEPERAHLSQDRWDVRYISHITKELCMHN